MPAYQKKGLNFRNVKNLLYKSSSNNHPRMVSTYLDDAVDVITVPRCDNLADEPMLTSFFSQRAPPVCGRMRTLSISAIVSGADRVGRPLPSALLDILPPLSQPDSVRVLGQVQGNLQERPVLGTFRVTTIVASGAPVLRRLLVLVENHVLLGINDGLAVIAFQRARKLDLAIETLHLRKTIMVKPTQMRGSPTFSMWPTRICPSVGEGTRSSSHFPNQIETIPTGFEFLDKSCLSKIEGSMRWSV
jgi:hypothetical protein